MKITVSIEYDAYYAMDESDHQESAEHDVELLAEHLSNIGFYFPDDIRGGTIRVRKTGTQNTLAEADI